MMNSLEGMYHRLYGQFKRERNNQYGLPHGQTALEGFFPQILVFICACCSL
jgi:hypothetical protein